MKSEIACDLKLAITHQMWGRTCLHWSRWAKWKPRFNL